MIEVVCICGRKIDVQDEHAGMSIKCPKCRRLVAVPATPALDPVVRVDSGGSDRATAMPEGSVLDPQPEVDGVLGAIERLTDTCNDIKRWLAGIFVVLVLLLVRTFFRG